MLTKYSSVRMTGVDTTQGSKDEDAEKKDPRNLVVYKCINSNDIN